MRFFFCLFLNRNWYYLYPPFYPPVPSAHLAAIHCHPLALKQHQSGLKSQQQTWNWRQKTEAVLTGHIQGVHILLPLCQSTMLLSHYLSKQQPQFQICYSYINYIGSFSGSTQEARWDAKIYDAHKCTSVPQRKNTVKLTSIKPQKYMLY